MRCNIVVAASIAATSCVLRLRQETRLRSAFCCPRRPNNGHPGYSLDLPAVGFVLILSSGPYNYRECVIIDPVSVYRTLRHGFPVLSLRAANRIPDSVKISFRESQKGPRRRFRSPQPFSTP
ncbi:hypothetical protein L596_007800 [Steinernema carpocapsae]|uniref:Uncharacterized protein n=1 Tax=Steinernema carpocapsae TaxID=34508 RepID=A0A4U5PAU0_STECR|nr:hypothetical protein L596_007800 [Steinernema carpocapsae]